MPCDNIANVGGGGGGNAGDGGGNVGGGVGGGDNAGDDGGGSGDDGTTPLVKMWPQLKAATKTETTEMKLPPTIRTPLKKAETAIPAEAEAAIAVRAKIHLTATNLQLATDTAETVAVPKIPMATMKVKTL